MAKAVPARVSDFDELVKTVLAVNISPHISQAICCKA